jgi:ribonuclease-3
MNRRSAATEALQRHIGHQFSDKALLELALTHSSVGKGGPRRPPDNERLEFLGDRVLGLAIAQVLMEADAGADAGAMTKRFGSLVSGAACARVARAIGLGDALRMDGGDSRRGGRDLDTPLADACEALIAALYIELGFDGAAAVVRRLWAPLLAERHDPATANPKSALQEWAASMGRQPPAYRLISRTGPDHGPSFVVEVTVEGEPPATGEGGSLQAAQKSGALALLERVKVLS